MGYPRKINNFNAFVDGISYFGKATTAKLPDVKILTEAHRGTGMLGPVGMDMGNEAMSSEISFAEWDPALFKRLGKITRFVLRPAAPAADSEAVDTIIATLGGLITETTGGELKVGGDVPLKLVMDVREFALEINGSEVIAIDMVNGIRRVGGVDQMAAARIAMGI